MMSFTPLILAGGLGTRLRPAISNLPKVLSPVNGRPFLSYLLDQLVEAGIEKVVLCTGHLEALIREAFGCEYRGIAVQYSHEMTALGTGGALCHALALVSSEWVLAMNGDSYCGIDLKSYIGWHFKKKYNASLVLTKIEDTGRYGSVKIDKDGRVLSFEEKCANVEPGWINGGFYMLRKSLLVSVSAGIKFSLERDLFPKLLDTGLYGFCFHGKFIDIGTPESYLSAKKLFSEGYT